MKILGEIKKTTTGYDHKSKFLILKKKSDSLTHSFVWKPYKLE
jgi:hypothetical protein